MLQQAVDFFRWTKPWREQFGTITGLRVALALRQAIWSAPANTTVKVHVPNLAHPIVLRAGTSDGAVFVQVFGDRLADFPVSGESDPLVIVDAGANIGLLAVVFATRFPSAQVLALEIDQNNFSLLEENTRPYTNIKPILKGLWSKKTQIHISNPEADAWAFQVSDDGGDGAPSVPAIGVRDILADFGYSKIDLLKIDIEGAEYEVFRDGVEEWIDRIGMIAVEVHDRFRPGCSEVIRRALEPHGFEESSWSEYLLFSRSNG